MSRIEPVDRNKTALTHAATATTAAWLDSLGCKPVETEVPLEGGWIADLATFWTPTLTEARRAKLIRDLVPDAIAKQTYEYFVQMASRFPARLTIVVEVKTARADFLGDRGRKYTVIGPEKLRTSLAPPAHLCVLAAPKSVLKDDRLDNWGWLQLSEDCTRVTKWHGPWCVNPLHPYQVEDLLASVAVRRDHATRYQGLRRFMKSWRARKGNLGADMERRECHHCGNEKVLTCPTCHPAGVAGAAAHAIASIPNGAAPASLHEDAPAAGVGPAAEAAGCDRRPAGPVEEGR